MSNTSTLQDVARVLGIVATAGDAVMPLMESGSTAAWVVRSIIAAVKFSADLAAHGSDPYQRITRLHDEEPLLSDVEAHWRDRLRAKFGDPT